MNESIKSFIIVEKFFKRNRWWVRLDRPFGGSTVMPHANYVWLIGNPSFERIPRGYAIHHLDGDKLNDSNINLVLMQRHYHMAHHMEHKETTPDSGFLVKVYVDEDQLHPCKEPEIYYRESRKRYYVVVHERIDGVTKRSYIYSNNQGPFITRSMAQEYKDKIWSSEVELSK